MPFRKYTLSMTSPITHLHYLYRTGNGGLVCGGKIPDCICAWRENSRL